MTKENQNEKNDNDDLFHDIINPYESSVQKGREDGRNAAFEAGYRDGYQLGKLKALEMGIELGYMSSICTMALTKMTKRYNGSEQQQDHISSTSSSNYERKRKRIMDLLDAIESFPKAEIIFQHCTPKYEDKVEQEDDNNNEERSSTGHHNNIDDTTLLSSSSREEIGNLKDVEMDIVSMMQRLRAKFKTILVQLNLSPLRLKDVMDNCNRLDDSNNILMKQGNEISDTKTMLDRIDEW